MYIDGMCTPQTHDIYIILAGHLNDVRMCTVHRSTLQYDMIILLCKHTGAQGMNTVDNLIIPSALKSTPKQHHMIMNFKHYIPLRLPTKQNLQCHSRCI